MNFTQESKSQLAKLMATENIIVEHQKIPTAAFNLKDRVLYCPIWKDMSGDLYDLLLGHEVGHALETPEKGWHNAVTGTGKFEKSFKHFLNVVEDARIEKKMKRRYPGLRSSFVRGYASLIERDFFGLKNRDINSMPFVDRLNLHTKGGVAMGVTFSVEEHKLVAQVEGCESWDDVVRVTEAIFEYSKQEQKELEDKKYKMPSRSFDDMDDYEFSDEESDEDSSGAFSDSKTQDKGEPKSTKEDLEEDSVDTTDGKNSNESINGQEFQREKESRSVWNDETDFDDYVPECETDQNFRANEFKLLDSRCKEYVYVEIPKPILKNILTPAKRVHELMEKSWGNVYAPDQQERFQILRDKFYNEFKQKNDRYVGLLAKEFEMRKAASKFAKAKVSESGDIDISRIYKYQVDDNIFRKITKVPKGKSHGLVMLFDRSGSMQYNMASTIEQMMVVASFCRKVNIPFVVYGFGNNDNGWQIDHDNMGADGFTQKSNEMALSRVYLREYLNSSMNNSEFQRCMKNLALLTNAYGSRSQRKVSVPASEGLSNTPMIEAMVAMQPLTIEFREKHKLDIVNMILLHDGDTDSINYKHQGYSQTQYFDTQRHNVIVQDKKNKFQVHAEYLDYDSGLRSAVFKWYTETTGAKVVGFFITACGSTGHAMRSTIERRYVDEKGKFLWNTRHNSGAMEMMQARELSEELGKQMRDSRFVESYNHGYGRFFIIPGGDDLAVENESLQIEGQFTAAKLRNAFIKMNKKKQVSRVLVNRFIGLIAL